MDHPSPGRLLSAATIAVLATFSGPSTFASTDYLWCSGSENGGNRVFYSDAFPVPDYTNNKYDRAWFEYLHAHYGVTATTGCQRAKREQTAAQARSERDADAGFYRQVHHEIVFTNWTY